MTDVEDTDLSDLTEEEKTDYHKFAGKPARYWCWTAFGENANPKWDYWEEKPIVSTGVRYAIWQLEAAPTTGRLHLQGYVELEKPQRFSWIKKWLGDKTARCAKRRGTRIQAREYCRKEDTRVEGPWEMGVWDMGGQGNRNDITDAVTLLRGGARMVEVLDFNPNVVVRMSRGLREAQGLVNQRLSKEFRTVEVEIYWGEAGTGKTRLAYDTYGIDNVYTLGQSCDRVWFDGYEGEKVLLIDDFYGWIKWGMFLRLLDGHQQRLEVKGGHTWALWTKVIITSNDPPHSWYEKGITKSFFRRVTTCSVVTKSGVALDPDFKVEEPKELTHLNL